MDLEKSPLIGIVATGLFLSLGFLLTGSGLMPLLVLWALVAISMWVGIRVLWAGYFALFAPLLALLVFQSSSPEIGAVAAGLLVAVGVSFRGRGTRSFALALGAVLVVLAGVGTLLSDASGVVYGAALVILFPIFTVMLLQARLRSMELEEIDADSGEPAPPSHVGEFESLGFEPIGHFAAVGQRITILTSPDRLSWVEANWSTRNLVATVSSLGSGMRMLTATRSLEDAPANTFVQSGAGSAAEAVAWHVELLESLERLNWAPDELTGDDVVKEARRAYADFDARFAHAAKITLRAVTRRSGGVRGPVDAASPELGAFLESLRSIRD